MAVANVSSLADRPVRLSRTIAISVCLAPLRTLHLVQVYDGARRPPRSASVHRAAKPLRYALTMIAVTGQKLNASVAMQEREKQEEQNPAIALTSVN